MTSYSISPESVRVSGINAVLLRLAFNEPATNDVIVQHVDALMRELKANDIVKGGHLVLLNGPASLLVIATIAHHVAHMFGAVGIYDPKLAGYVIAISHDQAFAVGHVIRSVDEECRR